VKISRHKHHCRPTIATKLCYTWTQHQCRKCNSNLWYIRG